MEMHPIQTHIMKALTNNRALHFAQIKPMGVDSNQFSYHLKTLIKKAFIKKVGEVYSLTTQGVRYSTQVSFEQFFVRIQPKIVTFIVCQNPDGKYLVYKRNKLPFLDMYGFPYGKIHLGEKVDEAAERELKEKAGIEARLAQKGIMYLTVVDEVGEVITHILCHIFSGKSKKGGALKNPPYGQVSWMSEKELFTQHTMPGVKDVLEISRHKQPGLVFKECEFQEI